MFWALITLEIIFKKHHDECKNTILVQIESQKSEKLMPFQM